MFFAYYVEINHRNYIVKDLYNYFEIEKSCIINFFIKIKTK